MLVLHLMLAISPKKKPEAFFPLVEDLEGSVPGGALQNVLHFHENTVCKIKSGILIYSIIVIITTIRLVKTQCIWISYQEMKFYFSNGTVDASG